MKLNKLNLFSQSKGLQAINPSFQAVEAVKSVGKNPFKQNNAKNNQGVGIVNSSLSNMSYVIPNGKRSTCNTIGIA